MAQQAVTRAVEKVTELDEDTTFTPEEAGELVAGLFEIGASRLGDHWKLSDEEREMIGRPLSKVLNKHWDSVGRFAEETALALAVASLVGGKLREHTEAE